MCVRLCVLFCVYGFVVLPVLCSALVLAIVSYNAGEALLSKVLVRLTYWVLICSHVWRAFLIQIYFFSF